ncbi:secreted RxLR effector protein 161-like [Vicia villosa]|uniref:secreted RxLR effector protein 161-like n=1 Tax=Vicia villosa TaxID=3911 RepID=UPI00273ADFC4|nr:secreted RxLR effector protein 161-like [Vicia villosa]
MTRITHPHLSNQIEKHGEENKVDATLLKQIVGSLRYVCNSRPDICFAIGLVSRYRSEPSVSHVNVARRILRYLKGSINYENIFRRDSESKEVVINFYLYVDCCGDEEDRRSTTSYFFQVLGDPISWCSRKQHVVALPLCEAEYIVGSYVVRQAIWIKYVLEEIEVEVKKFWRYRSITNQSLILQRIQFCMEEVSKSKEKVNEGD